MRAKEARQKARGQNSAEVAAYPLSSCSHFPFSFCLIKVNHLQSSTDWEEALLFFSPHRGGNPKTTVSQEGMAGVSVLVYRSTCSPFWKPRPRSEGPSGSLGGSLTRLERAPRHPSSQGRRKADQGLGGSAPPCQCRRNLQAPERIQSPLKTQAVCDLCEEITAVLLAASQ